MFLYVEVIVILFSAMRGSSDKISFVSHNRLDDYGSRLCWCGYICDM